MSFQTFPRSVRTLYTSVIKQYNSVHVWDEVWSTIHNTGCKLTGVSTPWNWDDHRTCEMLMPSGSYFVILLGFVTLGTLHCA